MNSGGKSTGLTNDTWKEKYSLKHRKRSVFPCDKCEYTAIKNGNLKRHKESSHDGVRYPCDLCEYAATAKISGNNKRTLKGTQGDTPRRS